MNAPSLLGMIFVLFLVPGVLTSAAQTESDPDIILVIAAQAHEEIRTQLDGAGDIPGGVAELFREGTGELDALREAVAREDPAARTHFLAAMDIFKKVSHMISGGTASEADRNTGPDPKSSLDRAAKYIASLKGIAATHGITVDFAQLDQLSALAQRQIRDGMYNDAQKSVLQINMQVADIEPRIEQAAQKTASDRARQFAQGHLDGLRQIIADARELGYPSDVIAKLDDARAKLSESSDPDQIIEEIKWILSIKEQVEHSKIDAILAQADRINAAVNALAATGADADHIADLRGLLSDLQSSIAERNHEGAQSLLRTLTAMLDI